MNVYWEWSPAPDAPYLWYDGDNRVFRIQPGFNAAFGLGVELPLNWEFVEV